MTTSQTRAEAGGSEGGGGRPAGASEAHLLRHKQAVDAPRPSVIQKTGRAWLTRVLNPGER